MSIVGVKGRSNFDIVVAMNTKYKELTRIFQVAKDFVTQSENDFTYSSWRDTEHAVSELDGVISRLVRGDLPPRSSMECLFLPTGPMQELAESSGWGDRFLTLADEFDSCVRELDLG